MLSMVRAQSKETFAFPHKLSSALQHNECIFVHPLLFKYVSKWSRCLIEHYNPKMLTKQDSLKLSFQENFFPTLSLLSVQQDLGYDTQEVVGGRGEGGPLMLYRLAEGERQRRPRPIQRPQCNSSRMPSIPMCCVKVEPTLNYEWTFLFV